MFKNKIIFKKTEKTLVIFILIISLFSIFFILNCSAQEKPESLSIMTGSMGGGWYTLGSIMADIFIRNGVKSSVEIGYGGTNIVLLERGEAELGMTASGTLFQAKKGEAPFDKKYESINGIGKFGEDPLHIFVFSDSGIDKLEDIKGKRIATSLPGSENRLILDVLLEVCGLTEEDVTIVGGSQTEGAALLSDKHVDILFISTAVLSATVAQVDRSLNVKLLELSEEEVEKAHKINSGLFKCIIPANTYRNQPKGIVGIADATSLIVRKGMPEEEAYWITKTLVENIESIKQYAPLKNLTPETMSKVEGTDLHPGARKYYEEIGIK